jgi:hypothetical protein
VRAANGKIYNFASVIVTEYSNLKPIVILYNYQTMIAGILALLGAGATVWIIHKQISQAEQLEKRRRERQNIAARAAMPAALSELCFYCQRCVEELVAVLPAPPNQRVTTQISLPPPVPSDAISTLRQCIEFAEGPIAERIADLISALQVQNTRVIDIRSRAARDASFIELLANINHYIIDALEVHARCSALFPYARRVEDTVPPERTPTAAEVLLSARLCELYEEHADIHEEIRRKYAAK